ncbi:MAG: TadE/TadG family type IV pilus assembly protein [Solirubrobacteraceae bacterium]
MLSPTTRLRAERGATTVEFVAVLPVVIALALGAWQTLVAGQAAWLSGGAAAAAARAHAVGGDPRAAAKSALPSSLHRGLRVRVGDDEVVVRIAVPVVVGERRLGVLSARAHLRDQQS